MSVHDALLLYIIRICVCLLSFKKYNFNKNNVKVYLVNFA